MIGPPGSGKGTQTQLLSKYFHIPCISTGEILRKEIKKNKKTKKYIKKTINKGKLIKNSFIIKIIEKNIKKKKFFNGFILDGFPRNIEQAKSLSKKINIEYIIYLKIKYDDIIKRITGRLIHASSGRTYHKIFNPPKIKNKDDITQEKLCSRNDDNEKTIKIRLQEYKKHTNPLIKWIKKKKKIKFIEIHANQSIKIVNKKIIYNINNNNINK
ncbi:nucleoside monophosphate kinase [Buchnera aphidicola]|nr:nucleoside monophosphate kinase [Buchnera aphidicola]